MIWIAPLASALPFLVAQAVDPPVLDSQDTLNSQDNGLDLVATESAHFTGNVLKHVAERSATFSLSVVEIMVRASGQDLNGIPAVAHSLLAIGILLMIVGGFAWWSTRLIRAYLSPQRRSRPFLIRALLISIIRPLRFLIWIYGGFVAVAPLLIFLEGQSQLTGAQMFGMLHYVIVASTLGGLVWFLLAALAHVSHRIRALARRDHSPSLLATIGIPLVVNCLDVIVPLTAVILFLELVPVPSSLQSGVTGISAIVIILTLAWCWHSCWSSWMISSLSRFDISAADNLRARTIYTQVYVIQRIGLFILGLITIAGILLVFPAVRQLGQALLASAGAAGIILGFALQRTLGNLFAGILIAFTQPIRLDDVVIVEGEWGWIEEITLTYVVVKVWDWRRWYCRSVYFIEQPFQNWTRTSASIIGTIFMYVDYTIPVEDLRSEFEAIVKKHPLWDRRVYCLQVTELKERTVELRVLVSAVDSPKAWDLRCDVREAMLKFVQHRYPECLPVFRLDTGKPIPTNGHVTPRLSDSSKHLMVDEIRDIETT
ncbi:MAG: mechanosensitive ion channel, partial [Synechococcaceae cyanobacterium RM1_1_27]|nr:mechanosensitive ion channel [Synechococcaceae cyanobacterium RM1_1_27]